MKIFSWLRSNILFALTLFLLAFIPLYPKLPIINVTHTWVYIRAEDFIVAAVFFLWTVLMFKRKVSFKTPLTIPIIIFWIVGAIATIHGILLIFPTLANVFPNVALMNYLRRIEYMSLFFIAYSAIKDKRVIPYVVGVLAFTLFLVSFYGVGQKFFGFPAFLTMNEEFAKGTPIYLSALSRVSSTFGGHYDLAAYLVLTIPLLSSMVFGFKNLFIKFLLLLPISLGFVVLFMTVSRVSFIVLLLAMILLLILQKQKKVILAMVSLFLIVLIFLSFSTSLLARFGNTVKQIDVLVDMEGNAVGNIQEIPTESFKDKLVLIKFARNKNEVDSNIGGKAEEIKASTPSSLVFLASQLPSKVLVLVQPNASTGENLPQGTGYVNLPLTPIEKKIDRFFYIKTSDSPHIEEILAIEGEFMIKKAIAYDLSFTTRFQGEWPRAIAVFKKDIFFGGGYSAVGLAVDNDYFRILGEVGLLGFISYFSILLIAFVYVKKVLPQVDSRIVRSFLYGFIAGSFGLILNATLIDVFEASKIAFTFWLLLGIAIGITSLYQKGEVNPYKEFKKAITSSLAVISYLFTTVVVAFSGILNYFFVGDDFIWFRWIADCQSAILGRCPTAGAAIFSYFTNSNGFFYRPGTKAYFFLMYSIFWLNQSAYHLVSIFLHFAVAMLLFLIFKRILKDFFLSALSAFLFIILSGPSEEVFWISATGHLFNALFILLSLFLFILWREKKKNLFFVLSILSIIFSLLFYELGIVAPLIIILYSFVFEEKFDFKALLKKKNYSIFFLPIIPYFAIRYFSGSHWLNGDYSYNLLKLPFNLVGNTIGYFMLSIFGPSTLPLYEKLRILSKSNFIFALIIFAAAIFAGTFIYKKIIRKMASEEQRIIIFGFLFFIVSLLPFLGFGNITSRYSYLASAGFILIFVFFLKKIYVYLENINGRDIALGSLVIIISLFSLVQIIELQKVQSDWLDAGKKVQTFVISLDNQYKDSWKSEAMNLYFVNVPIRQGDAWVFPVGLKDVVWFVTQNDKIRVYQSSSLEEAFSSVKDPVKDTVFLFNDTGAIEKKFKPVQ
ncbi:MAG: O-antigen ligase family protein [Candidatus Levybacteria bacterium]|nr:O-antigen ligase family protein [Candidatus Levybacteria bacterium]